MQTLLENQNIQTEDENYGEYLENMLLSGDTAESAEKHDSASDAHRTAVPAGDIKADISNEYDSVRNDLQQLLEQLRRFRMQRISAENAFR